MLPFSHFDAALPYERFLTQFGSAGDKARWDRTREAVALTDDQRALLAKFTRRTNVLVLAGAWCGDCAAQCPIFERFAEAAPVLAVRYLDRDAHPEAQQELKINGGDRVPVVVFFSEDGFEVARYGERTLSTYRRLAGEASDGDVAADWLREFERVQWILRLSPRLRKLHND
ncbi:MAG TPA: thioredoxin family protein [Fimbriiglobus sp.]|jgi:thiol-disulfide isomerase/thioredoxin|nr:thioredoxin family protein [Fimbriiglobus sp.]